MLVVYQEIGYFDDHNNNVGALCTRLSTDASQIQGVSGYCHLRRTTVCSMEIMGEWVKIQYTTYLSRYISTGCSVRKHGALLTRAFSEIV